MTQSHYRNDPWKFSLNWSIPCWVANELVFSVLFGVLLNIYVNWDTRPNAQCMYPSNILWNGWLSQEMISWCPKICFHWNPRCQPDHVTYTCQNQAHLHNLPKKMGWDWRKHSKVVSEQRNQRQTNCHRWKQCCPEIGQYKSACEMEVILHLLRKAGQVFLVFGNVHAGRGTELESPGLTRGKGDPATHTCALPQNVPAQNRPQVHQCIYVSSHIHTRRSAMRRPRGSQRGECWKEANLSFVQHRRERFEAATPNLRREQLLVIS